MIQANTFKTISKTICCLLLCLSVNALPAFAQDDKFVGNHGVYNGHPDEGDVIMVVTVTKREDGDYNVTLIDLGTGQRVSSVGSIDGEGKLAWTSAGENGDIDYTLDVDDTNVGSGTLEANDGSQSATYDTQKY